MRFPKVRLSAVFAASALWLVVGIPSLGLGISANLASASTIPLCGGNNFVGGWVGVNGAGGTSIFDIAFINEGHNTCRLTGYPTIQGYRNTREYSLAVGHMKDSPFGISSTIVAPRMSAEMVLTTSALCDALNSGSRTAIEKVIAKNTYTVSVKFPHSNDPIYIYGLSIDVACGLNSTQVGWR
ncbi:MAG TPA: DUF4232 domain-containing protein [Acidimicrobiales bacterium]|nr:DUF4232 domain-containing protein [Acidimicrobiales bacterium]